MLRHSFWLILIFACIPIHAASFNCAKASQLVESLICADPDLSALDDSLADAYRDALANTGAAGNLRAAQRQWLKSRNACQSKACLAQKYAARLTTLGAPATPVPIAPASRASEPPARVGDCADSVIAGKETRFQGTTPGEAGGELFVRLGNGLTLYLIDVSLNPPPESADRYMYSTSDFAIGDRVRVCLTSLPQDCPPGDDRGKQYSVLNYKNQLSFNGVDSWHTCGGA
jgi:uncharacterized protein YecT (DUF1311 family)